MYNVILWNADIHKYEKYKKYCFISVSIVFYNFQGFPPPETRIETLRANPILDFCSNTDKHKFDQLAHASNANEDMIVVMSDVYLDRNDVW